MRWTMMAVLTLAFAGGLALDGAAERAGIEGITGEAAASCTIDEVVGCMPSCSPPNPQDPKRPITCRL